MLNEFKNTFLGFPLIFSLIHNLSVMICINCCWLHYHFSPLCYRNSFMPPTYFHSLCKRHPTVYFFYLSYWTGKVLERIYMCTTLCCLKTDKGFFCITSVRRLYWICNCLIIRITHGWMLKDSFQEGFSEEKKSLASAFFCWESLGIEWAYKDYR